MMKTYGWIFAALLLSVRVSAQSVTPFVVAPAGDFFENTAAGASLSFTVGEMAMVETFFANQHFLTQGFQQPQIEAIAIAPEQLTVEEFVLYPNPADDFLNIRYRLSHPGQLSLSLIDLNGVTVIPNIELRYAGGLQENEIPLQELAQGMYVLRVHFLAPRKGIDHIAYHKLNIVHR